MAKSDKGDSFRNYSPYQQKIIKRYYDASGSLGYQKLQELVSEIYLSEGKKQEKLWTQVEGVLTKLELPAERIKHLMEKRDPKLLADVVQELSRK